MNSDFEEYVEFSKERDLGSIIGDTIRFLKYEWQPFFSTILKFSIIPVLIVISLSVYYAFYYAQFLLDRNPNDPFEIFEIFYTAPFLLLAFTQILAFAFISVSAYAYIKSYVENKGKINFDEIRATVNRKTLPYVGLYILNGLVIGVGLIFLVIPGIYLAVILAFSGCLLVFEDKNVGDAFSDAFSFLKEYWWEAFGVLLVVNIIIWVLNYIIERVIDLYTFNGNLITFDNEYSIVELIFSDPIYLALLVFSLIIGVLFNIVSTIATTIIYFDISEKRNPNKYDDVIDTLGNH